MEINYLIFAHKNPKQIKRLIDRLSSSNVNFYVHIDKDVRLDSFSEELATISNVYLFDDKERIAVRWGDISQVEATLLAVTQALKEDRKGYFILMSGQDYPIKSNEYINSFLQTNYGKNFIEGFLLPNNNWANQGMDRIEKYNINTKKFKGFITLASIYDKDFYTKFTLELLYALLKTQEKSKLFRIFYKRSFPKNITPFGGCNWWALPFETIELINEFLKDNPQYLKYHKYTLSADEIFFQSIIFSKLPKDKLENCITYVNWERTKGHTPAIFTRNDYEELKNRTELFARKFDLSVDAEIFELVDQKLLS